MELLNIALGLIVVVILFYITIYRMHLIFTHVMRASNCCYHINVKNIAAGTYSSEGYGGYKIIYEFNHAKQLLALHKWAFKDFFPTL